MLLYRLSSHSAEPEHRDTRTWGHKDARIQRHQDTGHQDRGTQGQRGTRIQGHKDTWDPRTMGHPHNRKGNV